MRRMGFALAFVINWCAFVPAQDFRTLVSESDQTIQEQIHRIYNLFRRAARDDLKTNCDVVDEIQRLKDMTNDKGEIVKQLAIFAAITESEEDAHVMFAESLLESLNLPSSIPIRVLAPYLDADNRQLRDFARIWFFNHDGHGHIQGQPPLGSVNYYDYMQYVRSKFNKNEEIPIPFIKYLYEEQPGKALIVFSYGSWPIGVIVTPQQRHDALRSRHQIELSEHIVSNAIWLKENGFAERFQASLPEAENELSKLAKRDEWWARLYVAEIVRQHRELRQQDVVQQLKADDNELVSECAATIK